MRYRLLGKTGLRVYEIGSGCASFWGKKVFDESAAIRLIESAVDHTRSLRLFGTVMIEYSVLRPEREPIIEMLAARNFGVLAGMALGGGLYVKDPFRIGGIQDLWYNARAWKNHRSDIKRGRTL